MFSLFFAFFMMAIVFVIMLVVANISKRGMVAKIEDKYFNAVFVIVFIVSFALSKFIAIDYVYSDGVKSGTLTKITKKGLIFKTYEGQLNLGGMVSNGDGGMVANVFNFSIKDEKLFKELQANQNSRVALKYNQYLNVPITVGSSNYIVESAVYLK